MCTTSVGELLTVGSFTTPHLPGFPLVFEWVET